MESCANETIWAWCAAVAVVAILAVLVMVAGANPLVLAGDIVQRALLDRSGLAESVTRAIPLTFIGLGLALAFRAQLFNIGADGQIIAGAALAVAVAPYLPGGAIGTAFFLLFGFVGGGVWGGIAGALKGRFNANEIIVTIMLNYVAIQLLSWLVRGPLQESMGILPRSEAIASGLRLPLLIEGTRVHLGLVVALLAAAVLSYVMRRTRFGFKLMVLGENKEAGAYAGQNVAIDSFLALALSGAVIGLAGAVEMSGVYGRLQEGFAPGYGITGIAVALVARLNPLMVPVSAFGFSLLFVGLGAVARGGAVPFPLIDIIEAAIIFLFVLSTVLASARRSRAMARAA